MFGTFGAQSGQVDLLKSGLELLRFVEKFEQDRCSVEKAGPKINGVGVFVPGLGDGEVEVGEGLRQGILLEELS